MFSRKQAVGLQRGMVQVMQGRHGLAHLTIEENLRTRACTGQDKAKVAATLEKRLCLLSALENTAYSTVGLHPGQRAENMRHWPGTEGQPDPGAAR